tara:strand:- start:1526 stop:2212 length:687 start_codon:yes stop_codon:yes gene_type:complete
MRTASIFLKKKLNIDIAHFLDNSQIHYLKKVMKIKHDEKFYTFDGNGLRALCILTSDSKLKVLAINQEEREYHRCVIIPLLKKARFEYALQKCVELGVNNIVAYISYKARDKYDFSKELTRLNRYKEIIKSAFLQSENYYLPDIEITEFLFDIDFENFKNPIFLDQNVTSNLKGNENVDAIIVGGEFGYHKKEIEFLEKQKNIRSFRISSNILRVETAPIVALAKLNY